MTTTSQRWIENRPSHGARALSLRELWSYRELVWFLALRDIKARYKQALFGVSWAVLQPLLSVAVFTLVFRRVADVSSDGLPYPVFALLGVTVWQYFASTLSGATLCLVANAALVTKVYFPRIVAPLAALVPGMVGLAVASVVLVGMMAWYGVAPGPGIVVLPLCLAALVALALGVGLVLATLNVKYRDVNHVIGVLTQLWMFASPVAYPSSQLPDRWQWVYALNPMSGIIDAFRWSVLNGPAPGWEVLASLATGTAVLVAGIWYFQRTERQFADVI
jgi:lipopolysaccharide transport system permease protein